MSRRLRVMTYNIWHGKNDPGLQRAAQVIRDAQPDIVGLQECWRDAVAEQDKLRQLTQELGWNDAFLAVEYMTNLERGTILRGPKIGAGQRAYGIAVVTPHEIKKTAGKILTFNPSADEKYKERRGILHAEVDVRGTSLNFFTAHLACNGQEKEVQCREIADFALNFAGPRILSGDFNTTPSQAWYRHLVADFTDAWKEKGSGDGLTFSSEKPVRRIDYILYQSSPTFTLEKIWLGDPGASDHFSLLADFNY